jgi:hypothetical protein
MDDEGDISRQLRELVEQLRHELLKAKVIELEARLAQYENAHTPPSLRRGGNRIKDQDKKNNGKPGQKIGHKGVTRPYVAPDTKRTGLPPNVNGKASQLNTYD